MMTITHCLAASRNMAMGLSSVEQYANGSPWPACTAELQWLTSTCKSAACVKLHWRYALADLVYRPARRMAAFQTCLNWTPKVKI